MHGAPPNGRDQTLDAARGLAVLLMVWVHFVPDEGPWTAVWAFDALPAALFTMLVGVSCAAGPPRSATRVWRRAATLAATGLLFWVFVWDNDILAPIAAMYLVATCLRGRARATWAVMVVVCVAVPFATDVWGGYVWEEVREDGTHEANHSLGWHTLRYFTLHGAYPLLPWVTMPLLGLRFAAARASRRALWRWLWVGVSAVVVGLCADRYGDAYQGGLRAHLDVTWQPTSLPFLLLWGGAACVVLAVLYLASLQSQRLASVGRWSLQHYLAHIALVFWPMTWLWSGEEWPWLVGVAAALGYAFFALTAAGVKSRTTPA